MNILWLYQEKNSKMDFIHINFYGQLFWYRGFVVLNFLPLPRSIQVFQVKNKRLMIDYDEYIWEWINIAQVWFLSHQMQLHHLHIPDLLYHNSQNNSEYEFHISTINNTLSSLRVIDCCQQQHSNKDVKT